VNVTEVIDEVFERTDNVRGSPADYVDRRLRLLVYVREIVDELWWLRDWSWQMVRNTVTFAAGDGFALVPADFHDWGHDGALYKVDGCPMRRSNERDIQILRERNHRTTNPEQYAMFGLDTATAVKLIQIPFNDADLVLPIWYQSLPPVLDETANVDNLRRIPAQYHRRVVVPGVRYRSEEAKSDARAAKTEEKYETGKAWMLKREARDQNKMVRLPSFFAR
jgi:hypothetical protein